MNLAKLLVVLALLPAAALADCCGFQFSSRWGGRVSLADVSGNVAVLYMESELIVVRVRSGPAMPELSRTRIRSLRSLALDGDILYAEQDQALLVMSIADPAHPALLARVPFNAPFAVHSADGGALYINERLPDERSQVRIFDVQNPLAPVPVSTLTDAIRSTALIHAADGRAYCAVDGRTLRTFDLSAPSQPTVISDLFLDGQISAVAVVDPFVYVKTGFDGMYVVDATDATAPSIVRNVAEIEGGGGAIIPGVLGRLYAEVSGGIMIVSLAEPAAPLPIGWFLAPPVRALWELDGRLITFSERGFDLYDVANPQNALNVGRFRDAGIIWTFATSGEVGYAASFWSGDVVNVFALTGAGAPRRLASLALPVVPDIFRLRVAGDYLWVGTSTGVYAANISAPAQPGSARLITTQLANDFRVIGDLLYVAAFNALVIYRVTDPSGLALEIGRVPITPRTFTVNLNGDYAYVGGGAEGTAVVDVSDPAAPFVERTVNVPLIREMVVNGSIAYAATNDGVLVLDVADPSRPRRVADIAQLSSSQQFRLEIRDGELITLGDSGLAFIDLTNPRYPVFSCRIGAARGYGLAVFDDRIITGGEHGLHVFEASTDTGTPGDIDHDGDVDLADLATMLGNGFGLPAVPGDPDLDCDGQIGLGDLAILLANFGV